MSHLQHESSSTQSYLPISELLVARTDEALSELIRFYRPLLIAIADRELEPKLRQKIGVSDIVQDACYELVFRFPGLQAKCRRQFWAYLKLLIHHKLHSARRFYKLAQRRDLRREVFTAHTGDIKALVGSFEPQDTLIMQEELEELKLAVSRLPSELQLLLRWRYCDNMSYVTIGAMLTRSGDDVRMLIVRCLRKLRNQLELHDPRLQMSNFRKK